MMIVIGLKVIGNGHTLTLHYQDAANPGAVATLFEGYGL
jgi:hypothetical protein